MTKASDNLFPSVLLQNTSNSAITTPTPWNAQRLFFDADGTLKKVDSSDTVTAIGGGGGGTITFGGVSSTDTVTVASNFAVSDQGGGTARLDVFFPASGGGSFDPDVHMSRRILILPQLQPPDTTPQGTWVGTLDINNENVLYSFLRTQATTIGARLFYNSTQAQNDECTWNVPLSAGTWTVRFYGRKSTNTGIITCEIDGSSVGTVDTYAGAVARLEGSITGITVATTGLKALGILVATKNASSSSYYVQLDAIELQRTA